LHFAHATSTEKCAYEIPIRPGLERSGFYWIDWEVFLVTKRVVD
ncbi:6646_t:CDS:1, partial [Paraglomus occultum]